MKVRAEWKGGKLLLEIERMPGERTDLTSCQSDGKSSGYYAALKESGLSEPTARRWQIMSYVPEDELETYFAKQRAQGKDITSADVYRMGREYLSIDQCDTFVRNRRHCRFATN